MYPFNGWNFQANPIQPMSWQGGVMWLKCENVCYLWNGMGTWGIRYCHPVRHGVWFWIWNGLTSMYKIIEIYCWHGFQIKWILSSDIWPAPYTSYIKYIIYWVTQKLLLCVEQPFCGAMLAHKYCVSFKNQG